MTSHENQGYIENSLFLKHALLLGIHTRDSVLVASSELPIARSLLAVKVNAWVATSVNSLKASARSVSRHQK